MDFGPVVDPISLKLPLDRIAWVGGDTESGPDIPRAFPCTGGVLIRRNNSLSYHSHGLRKELWSHNVPGSSGFIWGPNAQTILIKPEIPIITQYAIETGATKQSIDTHSPAILVGCSEHNLLLMSVEKEVLIAFDWSGKHIWEWKYQGYCRLVSTPQNYIVVETGTRMHVFDAASGRNLWQFEAEKTGDKGPQDNSNAVTPGFPSVVVFNEQLMTIVGDGRVFKHHLATGELISQGQAPFRGAYQVSSTSIFSLSQITCEFAQYEHLSMKEIKRENLTKPFQQLFQGLQPRVNALLVTDGAIFWSTMYGTLMGLERGEKRGKTRLGWTDFLGKGVLMPIAVPPKALEGYMYYSAMSIKPGVPKGLVCYQAAS